MFWKELICQILIIRSHTTVNQWCRIKEKITFLKNFITTYSILQYFKLLDNNNNKLFN